MVWYADDIILYFAPNLCAHGLFPSGYRLTFYRCFAFRRLGHQAGRNGRRQSASDRHASCLRGDGENRRNTGRNSSCRITKRPECRLRNQTGAHCWRNRRCTFRPHVYPGASYQRNDTTSQSVNSRRMLVGPFYIFPSVSVLSVSSGCWSERKKSWYAFWKLSGTQLNNLITSRGRLFRLWSLRRATYWLCVNKHLIYLLTDLPQCWGVTGANLNDRLCSRDSFGKHSWDTNSGKCVHVLVVLEMSLSGCTKQTCWQGPFNHRRNPPLGLCTTLNASAGSKVHPEATRPLQAAPRMQDRDDLQSDVLQSEAQMCVCY